ncbi:MAG: hypothetical protein KC561_19080 [Myxococcales bacterium]|nr:hypothetical protein [Myxococcales bacterium]
MKDYRILGGMLLAAAAVGSLGCDSGPKFENAEDQAEFESINQFLASLEGDVDPSRDVIQECLEQRQAANLLAIGNEVEELQTLIGTLDTKCGKEIPLQNARRTIASIRERMAAGELEGIDWDQPRMDLIWVDEDLQNDPEVLAVQADRERLTEFERNLAEVRQEIEFSRVFLSQDDEYQAAGHCVLTDIWIDGLPAELASDPEATEVIGLRNQYCYGELTTELTSRRLNEAEQVAENLRGPRCNRAREQWERVSPEYRDSAEAQAVSARLAQICDAP